MGQPSWESSLLDNPDAKFFCENGGTRPQKKKRAKQKETEACGNSHHRPDGGLQIKTFFRQRFT